MMLLTSGVILFIHFQLIDAYLHLLAEASDSVYYINAAFSTAIFNDTQEVHGLLRNVSSYRFINIK